MTMQIEKYGKSCLLHRIKQHFRHRKGFVPYGFRTTKRYALENRALFE